MARGTSRGAYPVSRPHPISINRGRRRGILPREPRDPGFREILEVDGMAKLSDEMKAVFSKTKSFPVATASRGGVPNVTPIGFVQIVSDDTIWLGDNYMMKTLANAKENPWMAIVFWDPETKKCFQVKGKVAVKTSGEDFEKMKRTIKAKNEKYPAKSLLVLSITEIFECTPGASAGKKIA
jgi:predicted pyridoxine 5'-phosphate oxidase superfamily flavin-nucleotide-binding protein